MRLQKLFTDDDAVSPVIGVILMVAITVILAAVIASLVVGLGQDAGETAPTASFDVSYENSTGTTWNPDPSSFKTEFDGNVTVTHESGDTIREDFLFFRGDNFNGSDQSPNLEKMTTEGYVVDGETRITGKKAGANATVAGDEVQIPANTTYELKIVWDPENTDTSTTLIEDNGPEAPNPS